MADKLRKTQPLKISFSEGEQPSGAKLSVMATQTRQGSAILERVVGDLWNQSGDSVMIDFPLQIPNLARLLGENQYLNPAMYPMFEDFTYYENIGAAYAGRTEGYLKFRPKTNSIASQTGTQFTNSETEEYLVGDPVDSGLVSGYWLDTETGRFRIDSPLAGTEIISYVVDPTVYEYTDDILPGIIPDPRQSDFTGVKVTQDSSNRDLIVLPPRRPLDWGSSPSTFNGSQARPAHYPSDEDILIADNYETTASLPKRYWNDTGTAVEDEHYRYHLPKEILDAHASMAPGDTYPTGAMYLWDTVTKTIVEGVVFKKPNDGTTDRWVIEIDTTNSNFTFPSPTSRASEAEADYNGTDLILITCGSPVARNIFNILARQLTHSHNGGDLTNKVPHNSLDGLNPPDYTYTEHSSRYPTTLPRWSPSRWSLDDHTSLLSRAGSYGYNNARRRDPNDNAMLGDLVLANSVADGDNVFLNQSCPDDSFSICFGSTSGNKIYGTTTGIVVEAYSGSSDNGLQGIGDGSGEGLVGIGGSSGWGVYGEGVGGVWGKGSTYQGVFGESTSHHGVQGQTSNSSNYGVYGYGNTSGAGGVYGYGQAAGIGGRFISDSGYGVYGSSSSGTGIYGETSDASLYGVHGKSTVGHGLKGETTVAAKYGVEAVATTGSGLYATATSGVAVKGVSTSGYGGYFEGHSSGDASGKAALHIDPQDAAPSSSPARGDIYVNSTSGLPSIYDNNQWVRMGGIVHSITATDIESGNTDFPSSQYTIPANILRVGSVIRVRFSVYVWSIGAGAQWRAGFKSDGSTIFTTIDVNKTVGSVALMEMVGTVRSLGATGEIFWNGFGMIGPGSSFSTPQPIDEYTVGNVSNTVDTESGFILAPSVSESGPTGVFYLQTFTVEIY